MQFEQDLFVIGGGSGGVRAARIAAGEYGARVALAEADRMGGTCVIRGCVPKKLMVYASACGADIADARAYGWETGEATFDWSRFHRRLETELDRLEAAYRATLASAGVVVFDQRATIADAHSVRLADGRVIRAKHILIATGGRPMVPEIARAPGAMNSDDLFKLKELPRSMLIVGGGYVACEFASLLVGMGVQVTQYYRGTQILRGFDDELRWALAAEMIASGVKLRTGMDLAGLERLADGRISVRATDGSVAVFDAVLCATGRVANTEGLGLEDLGLVLGPKGEVPVDGYSQTAVPSVFAVGDVTNRANLTPAAIREGHAFADTVFGGMARLGTHDLVPSAVFTRPEFGTIGLTEEAARARGPVEIYASAFRPMRPAFAGRETRAVMKLVVAADSRRVLGCHILGPEAGEMIQLVAVAMGMGATKADFDRALAVHPTLAEELVTMHKPVRVT